MDLHLISAVAIGKVISVYNRFTGTGGTAAPGLTALWADPYLVEKLAGQLKQNILVTGTNGKTTTTRMIALILTDSGNKVIHNRAGSNLLRGVASTLIKNSTLFGDIDKSSVGLWETDEAAFTATCRQIKPDIIVITNLFRDQLDRYGEIDTVAKGWQRAIAGLPASTLVILNSDDATVAALGRGIRQKVSYYGIRDLTLGSGFPQYAVDATVCPVCFSDLKYKTSFVGHLGIYSCPNHDFVQPKPQISVTGTEKTGDTRNIGIESPGIKIKLTTVLPGNYNIYNFTAATAAVFPLGIPADKIVSSLSSFTPAFGRVETINVGNKKLHLFLVKNPTGFNEVIKTITENSNGLNCLIAINDLIADGRDVSWLWDVNFEYLATKLKNVIVSGSRAYDMALRLKYSLFLKFSIEPNLLKAIDHLLTTDDKDVYILPTYTAMLEIRKILHQKGLIHSSWKD